jgi:type IX secretion system PorP/SprF family membrane protein
LEDALVSTLDVRSQWVSLPGAPVSQSLTSNAPIFKINSAAGITIINDIAGQQRTTGASLAYAYHKRFGASTLSLGASGGIFQETINGGKLITPTGNYEGIIDHNDPNLPVTTVSNLIPDAALGLYFFGRNLTAGISANHLLLPITGGNDGNTGTVQYNPNGYVYLAYGFDAGNRIRIMPNVLYKTDLNEGVVDLNTLVTYNGNIQAGISCRANTALAFDAVALMAGMRVADRWLLSYSYDITLSTLNTVSSGSHEIVVRYSIPVARPRAGKMINNPRFLYH